MPDPNNLRPLLRPRSTHLLDPLRNPRRNKMLRRAPRQRLTQILMDPVKRIAC